MDHLQSVVMPRLRMAMRQGALVAILGAAVQATTAATPHMGLVSPSRAYVNHGFRAPSSVACEKVPGFVCVRVMELVNMMVMILFFLTRPRGGLACVRGLRRWELLRVVS